MLAQKWIISDQGAFDGAYGKYRNICFVLQFLLRSVSLNRPKNRENARWWDLAQFWRPWRGRSTWKGASPTELWFYMTRRAFLALRVIPVQGKSWSSVAANLLCAKRFGKLVIWRFLGIYKFNFASSAKINYFRSRRVDWSWRQVQENLFDWRIIAPKSFP